MNTLNILRYVPVANEIKAFFSKDGLASRMLIGLSVSFGFLLFWLAVKQKWG